MDERSPVHEIVNGLWRALEQLGSRADTNEIEKWGFTIHMALSAAGREFHNHEHVMDIASHGDPLEVLAALYHDAVYIQVDHGPPPSMRHVLEGIIASEPEGWRVLPGAAAAVPADILVVFGRKVGDLVTPVTGLNEFASALVAGIQLESALDRTQRIAIAACIEQTIPFRVDPMPDLHRRLLALGLQGDILDETLRRAVRFGNRDVENFCDNKPARFLDNTWKLLPESNPSLHSPMVYTVRDYRIALQKMEGFLAWLPADRVFHSWSDEPKPEIHARRVARTAGNLELAVRYLRAKLYSIGLVEAIAQTTGGDVPLDYFMGPKERVHREDEDEADRAPPAGAGRGAGSGSGAAQAAVRRARVGVELRYRTVTARRVPPRHGGGARGHEGRRDGAPVVGRRHRRGRLPVEPAAAPDRRDRARCREHHRDPPRSPVRARRAPRDRSH